MGVGDTDDRIMYARPWMSNPMMSGYVLRASMSATYRRFQALIPVKVMSGLELKVPALFR